MYPIILEQVTNLLQGDGAALAITDSHTNDFTIEGVYGSSIEVKPGTRLSICDGLIGQVIQAGEPRIYNLSALEHLWINESVRNRIDVAACVPLVICGNVIGALGVGRMFPFSPEEVQTLSALADIAANAIHLATLHEQTEKRLQRLTTLRTIDMAINASQDFQLTLKTLLDQIITNLSVDATCILLLNQDSQTLTYTAGQGFRTRLVEKTCLNLGEPLAGQAAVQREIVALESKSSAPPKMMSLLENEQCKTYFGVPLISKGQIVGVLEIFHRQPLKPDPEWIEFLEALAIQTALAIDNAKMVDNLQNSNLELALAYDTTLEGWSRALELRDEGAEGHSKRVAETVVLLAREMGINARELAHIKRGAILHDIGKMGIPDKILQKPGPLTDDERKIMQKHPIFALEMLSPIAYLKPCLDIPYCHHETWEGSGYPQGLCGEEIPIAARIFSIVDVWDALRFDRPYRRAWPDEKVLTYLREQSGKRFDPQVDKAFFKLLGL